MKIKHLKKKNETDSDVVKIETALNKPVLVLLREISEKLTLLLENKKK